MIVLDASALLAYMFRESGHEHVSPLVEDSCISAVNLSEVIGRFARDGFDAVTILRRISATTIEIVPFEDTDAAIAAALVPATAPHGFSLGDRACLALALARGLPALTADRAWADVDVGVRVQVIR